MAKVGKFCLAKRVKVEWLFQERLLFGALTVPFILVGT